MPDDLGGRGISSDLIGNRRPPPVVTPPVPRNALRMLHALPNPDLLVDACGTAAFAEANPGLKEWVSRRPAAVLRENTAAAEAGRLKRLLGRTRDAKCVPAGKEPGLNESLAQRCGKAVLFVVAFITIASAINVAAAYVTESAAWSSLVDQPLLAVLFVIVVPAAGVGGILGVASELPDDECKRRFRMGLAIATLVMWVLWLMGLARLYELQALIGDSGGRRLSDSLADADGLVRAWLLMTQLLAEVMAGALFKLLSAQAARRGEKLIVVQDALYEDLQRRFRLACDAAGDAGAEVGLIDDFEEKYGQRLAGFLLDCRGEFASLKMISEAGQASARAEFLRPLDDRPAADRRAQADGNRQ